MTSLIHALTIDCHDPEKVGRFWAEALGYGDEPDNPNNPGDPEWLLVSPDGSVHLLFQNVPEGKQVKNRLHLDLEPVERTRDEESAWLETIGATVVGDFRNDDGTGWVLMADVEDNEFCVLRSAAERARTA